MGFDIQQLKRNWNYWFNPTDLQLDIARDKRRESPKLEELIEESKKIDNIQKASRIRLDELVEMGALDEKSQYHSELKEIEKEREIYSSLRVKNYRQIDDEKESLEYNAQLVEGGMLFIHDFCEVGVVAPFEAFKAAVGSIVLVASLPFTTLTQTFQDSEANQK